VLPVLTACAAVSSILLAVWIALEVMPRARPAVVDRACAACFLALAATAVVALRGLVVAAPDARGPLPFFVFFGAPVGCYLAWLALRLARTRGGA
jgi:hypothetical protein